MEKIRALRLFCSIFCKYFTKYIDCLLKRIYNIPRACLKIAFCKMLAQFAPGFMLNFGGAVGYIDEIQHESWCEVGRQIAGMDFQAHSG